MTLEELKNRFPTVGNYYVEYDDKDIIDNIQSIRYNGNSACSRQSFLARHLLINQFKNKSVIFTHDQLNKIDFSFNGHNINFISYSYNKQITPKCHLTYAKLVNEITKELPKLIVDEITISLFLIKEKVDETSSLFIGISHQPSNIAKTYFVFELLYESPKKVIEQKEIPIIINSETIPAGVHADYYRPTEPQIEEDLFEKHEKAKQGIFSGVKKKAISIVNNW